MPRIVVEEFRTERLEILDKDGNVDRSLEPRIPDRDLLEMHRLLILSRIFDRKAIALQRQGRMLTYAPHEGQEAAQVGSAYLLRKDDWMFPSFRENCAYIVRGYPMHLLYVYWMGSELGMRVPEGENDFTVSIPVGSQLLHAVGAGYALKYKKKDSVVLTYFGDGATSEGDFHEALNYAGVWKVPVIFLCQNNQWAISVPRKWQSASKTIAQKAHAYNIAGIQVDGNDILAVYVATKEAIERAREGEGSTLIEAYTYRMGPHTTADDPTRYRDQKEVEFWRDRDPIKRFEVYLAQKGLLNEELKEKVRREAEELVEKAVAEAEAAQVKNPEDMFKYTYSQMTPNQAEQLEFMLREIEEKRKAGRVE